MSKNEHGLTVQQELFVLALVSGASQSEAYRRAYPRSNHWKAEAVHEVASRLAANAKVSSRVQGLLEAAAKAAELTATELMREIRRLALSSPVGLMHPDGRVKLPHELDAETAACIASFKVDQSGRIEYRFWDKNSALERASKILGLFEKDHGQKSDPLAALLKRLDGKVIGPVMSDVEDD